MEDWSWLEAAASLFIFALATQCALAWVFFLLFVAFLRTVRGPDYLRCWTRAWLARAIALSVIFVRFAVPILRGEAPPTFDGSALTIVCYSAYQAAKLLAYWWLVEGILELSGFALSRRAKAWTPVVLAAAGIASVLAARNAEDLLLFQTLPSIGGSLLGAYLLLGLEPARRSAGTRLTAAALLAQTLLWGLYFVGLVLRPPGLWPAGQMLWPILSAHSSYFDLSLDVTLAAGLVVLLLQDVQRRQREAELVRSSLRAELDRTERLRSLGKLVSGVAHELNNPLTAILGFAEALVGPDEESERTRYAQVIRDQALRCRRIVRGLSTFAEGGSEVRESVDLRPLLERVVEGFQFELARRRVRTTLEIAPGLPRITGDRFALEQMVTNLLANALLASPAGGRIALSASAENDQIELRVDDEGAGIPPEILPKIFDPFFSTRANGEGMGLGLAVVHGIVTAHDGAIRAENRAPHGARLAITLPIRKRSDPDERELLAQRDIPRPPAPDERRRTEVLVIEDEPLLCQMLESVGARHGWRVTIAGTGRLGLEELRAARTRFDAVLCDLRMDSPSGIEIHDQLAAADPELLERFLFFTGDLASDEAATFAQRCARPILRKPFRFAELAARVEEVAAARFSARPATRAAPRDA